MVRPTPVKVCIRASVQGGGTDKITWWYLQRRERYGNGRPVSIIQGLRRQLGRSKPLGTVSEGRSPTGRPRRPYALGTSLALEAGAAPAKAYRVVRLAKAGEREGLPPLLGLRACEVQEHN